MKLIKISAEETKEMSFEDIIFLYEKFINKTVKNWSKLYEKEDIRQLLLMGLFKAYKNYNVELGYCFSTLAIRLAMNEFLMYNRKVKHHLNVYSLNDEAYNDNEGNSIEYIDIIRTDVDIEENVIENEMLKEIKKAVDSLEDKSRELIIDSFVNGFTQMQIADKYHLSQSYVSRVIKKGLNRIKNKIA